MNQNSKTIGNVHIVCDSHHGQYLPQVYATNCAEFLEAGGITKEYIKTLQDGPDCEWYWETWETMINNFKIKVDGKTFTLYQDGDLFLVALDSMSDREKLEFFGEYF